MLFTRAKISDPTFNLVGRRFHMYCLRGRSMKWRDYDVCVCMHQAFHNKLAVSGVVTFSARREAFESTSRVAQCLVDVVFEVDIHRVFKCCRLLAERCCKAGNASNRLSSRAQRRQSENAYMDACRNKNCQNPPLPFGMIFLSERTGSAQNLPVDLFT